MGYHVKYDALQEFQTETILLIEGWKEQLADIQSAMDEMAGDPGMQGDTAASQARLALYANGYNEPDADVHAEIAHDSLEEQELTLGREWEAQQDIHNLIWDVVKGAQDIFPEAPPSNVAKISGYRYRYRSGCIWRNWCSGKQDKLDKGGWWN